MALRKDGHAVDIGRRDHLVKRGKTTGHTPSFTGFLDSFRQKVAHGHLSHVGMGIKQVYKVSGKVSETHHANFYFFHRKAS